MQLDLRQRVRVAAMRPVVRMSLRDGVVRRRLLAGQRAVLAAGLDPDLAVLRALDQRTGDAEVAHRTPAQARRHMRTSVAVVDDDGRALPVTTRGLTVAGAGGPLPARLYVADGLPSAAPGLVFFHGGGWVTGDLDTHDGLCRRLAARGRLRVIAVDYRLAPEHPAPAAADDAIAAFRDVAARAGQLGLDPARLAVGGDSAGGNLSALVALARRGAADAPALQVLIYPGLDFTCAQPSHARLADAFILNARSIAWYREQYLGPAPSDERLRSPALSPLFAEDVTGLAPALIVTAGFDPLRDEAVAYAARLTGAGVTVDHIDHPALVHGFTMLTAVSGACARATDALAAAVGDRLRG
ncbi:MAG: alpha/beta hydrolase [Kofleriaceae bacterium]